MWYGTQNLTKASFPDYHGDSPLTSIQFVFDFVSQVCESGLDRVPDYVSPGTLYMLPVVVGASTRGVRNVCTQGLNSDSSTFRTELFVQT